MEQWRDVPGFEGRYQVSDLGRVRTVPRTAERRRKDGTVFLYTQRGMIRTPTADKDGYLQLPLYRDGVPTQYKVHRLVAKVFLPNPDALPDVNHDDGDKTNNALTNLEWVTHKANGEHAAANALMARGERHGISKLKAADIPVIRAAIAAGWSMNGIAKTLRVSPATIFDVVRGVTWGHV